MTEPTITEPPRRTRLWGEYEVVVLGGGPAGITAALAAGRSGGQTILIEAYGFLGGAGTAAGLSTFCGLHAAVFGEHEQVVHGLCDDILDRLRAMDGLNDPHLSVQDRILAQAYDISAYKIAADELLGAAGVEILFHALGCGAVMAGDDRIEALLVETKSGRFAIRGQVFIDASGDGDLAAWAGVPFEIGDGAGNMLYPTTMFRINGVDHEKAGDAWKLIPKLMEEAEAGGRKFPRTIENAYLSFDPAGEAPINSGKRSDAEVCSGRRSHTGSRRVRARARRCSRCRRCRRRLTGRAGTWPRARAAGTENAVSGRDHARDLRARGLHRATRRAGAKAPRELNPLSRRVCAGESGSGRVVPKTRAAAAGKAVESGEPSATDRQRSLSLKRYASNVSLPASASLRLPGSTLRSAGAAAGSLR
jgi:hypothetical protein